MLFDTLPSRFWSYTNSSSAGITTTTPVTVHTPSGGNRTYITDISLTNGVSGGSTVVQLVDGTTVVWQLELGQYCPGIARSFKTPIRCGVGTTLTLQLTSTGKVFINLSGFEDSQ